MRKRALIALGLTGLAAPVLADNRDDALAAMMRCIGLADARARLACYDSAVGLVRGAAPAQPPGLSPAPVRVTQTAAIPPPAPPPRRPRKSGMDRFLSSIFGNGGPDRAPQTNVQQFGIEGVAMKGEGALPSHIPGDTIDAISARLIAYRFVEPNRLMVALDNDQEWIQIMGGDPVGRLARPALAYNADIRRGSNGAYLLRLSGIAKPIHVRRLR